MNNSLIIGLLQNATILLAFTILYDFFNLKKDNSKYLFIKLVIGFIIGTLGIILIATPWKFVPGIAFDTRSILLSVTGLFLGPVPTVVAVVLTGAYRIYLGGNGVFMGLAVILTSAGTGLLWRHFRPNWNKTNYRIELISMGLVVHFLMILCSFFLPSELILKTIKTIAFPVIIIYPLVTMLLGTVIQYRLKSWKIKQDLYSSENRWKFALEGAGDGIWDWNTQTNKVYFSKQWKEMLGYSEKEVGNSFEEWDKRIHPEDKEKVHLDLNNHFTGKTPQYITEYRILCKDGIYKWILSRGKVMEWTEDGKPLRVIGTHRNITEQRHANELVLDIKNRLDFALSSIETGVWELDLVNGNSWRSFKHDKIFGYTNPLKNWTYEMFLEHVVPEDKKMVDEKFQKALLTKTNWNFECRINRKDGQIRYILGKGNLELNDNIKTIKMYGIVQDITELKQAEEIIISSRKRLLEAERIGLTGNWSNEVATGKIEWSEGMYRIYGLDPVREKITYEILINRIHPDDRDVHNAYLDQMMALTPGTKLPNLEYRIILPVGEIRWINVKYECKFDDNKKPELFFGTVRDITEQQIAEEKIKQLNIELEQKVEERSEELKTKIEQIERINKLFVGRELRMKELKEQMKVLVEKLEDKNK